jgi:hypothetical protein
MLQRNASCLWWHHATIEILQAVFSLGLLWGYMTQLTDVISVIECSAVEYSVLKRVGGWAVRWLPQFGHCELLLLEAGSWDMVIVQEPRVRGASALGSHYQQQLVKTQQTEKTLYYAVVNCRMCELALALQLHVVMISKCSVNPITNPNPIYSHSYTWQYILNMA